MMKLTPPTLLLLLLSSIPPGCLPFKEPPTYLDQVGPIQGLDIDRAGPGRLRLSWLIPASDSVSTIRIVRRQADQGSPVESCEAALEPGQALFLLAPDGAAKSEQELKDEDEDDDDAGVVDAGLTHGHLPACVEGIHQDAGVGDSEQFQRTDELGRAIGTFVDEGLEHETEYEYAVFVRTEGGACFGPEYASATALDEQPPRLPVESTLYASSEQITIEWKLPCDEDRARALVTVDCDGWQGGSCDASTSHCYLCSRESAPADGIFGCSINEPQTCTSYCINVVDSAGNSSCGSCFDYIDPEESLPSPSDVTATNSIANGEVVIQWGELWDRASRLIIERRAEGSPEWTEVAEISGDLAGEDRLLDGGLEDGTTYFYRLRAQNDLCDTPPAQVEVHVEFDYDKDGLHEEEGDCDDREPLVHQGAAEVCDGRDNDCDGLVDQEDGDLVSGEEICDGIDNDCDGRTDGRDDDMVLPPCELQQGVCAGAIAPPTACVDGQWQPCMDLDYGLPEYGSERCDGLDNDCDGLTDTEDDDLIIPACENQLGVCADAVHDEAQCLGGRWQECGPAQYQSVVGYSLQEQCDELDNDCDGFTDELGYTSIAVGSSHACAIMITGRVRCWGNAADGRLEAPQDIAFELLSAGRDHTCGLSSDRRLHCWGSDAAGQCAVPETDVTFRDVTAGAAHSCAVTTSGNVICWGDDSHGQCAAPSEGGFTRVDASTHHSCALKEDGSISCWGGLNPENPQQQPPYYVTGWPREGRYVALALGDGVSHALTAEGEAVHWGTHMTHGTAVGATFHQISAAGEHWFGVHSDWDCTRPYGNYEDDAWQLQVPDGSYAMVDTSTEQACALRQDSGVAVCWGIEASAPPACPDSTEQP